MLAINQAIRVVRMPRKKIPKVDLEDLASRFKLTLPQLGIFIGYGRGHFTDMKNHPDKYTMTTKLYNSIEAHLMLSDENIEILKKRRL